MSGFNNSLRFYKTYYHGIRWDVSNDDEGNIKKFEAVNQKLCESVFPEAQELSFGYDLPEEYCFELSTVYPGLLLGSGISHGSGRQGEFKLGFFFDHTTGLPVIPGSSVKGALRAIFPLGLKHEAKKAKEEEKTLLLAKAEQVTAYLQFQLQHISGRDWSVKEIEQFETWLFGSYTSGEAVGPMSGRVIFHDAIPVRADMVRLNGKMVKRYLAPDFLTPHKNMNQDGVPDHLKNPVPIQFLKVLPGVEFRFQFALFPYRVEGKELLCISKIRDLFKALLLQFGVGAKTNVGYGQFLEPEEYLKRYSHAANSALDGKSNQKNNGKEEGGKAKGNKPDSPNGGKGHKDDQKDPPNPKPNPIDKLDFGALGEAEYYAIVLEGKPDKKKQFGDVKRLEVFKSSKERFQPFRAKDGSLQKYPPGQLLKVRIQIQGNNLQEIASFEILAEL